MHDFCESTRKEWPNSNATSDSEATRNHIGRPDFATFQFSNEYQEFYLSVFLSDRHHLHSGVAVLSEDETAFGNQEEPNAREESPKVSESCPIEPPKPVFSFMHLYFPREIAQLDRK